ncbi:alternate-type signal peptide domain-containing protein [Clavibacter michiganensis]|nr:alternate-type signal peptide domain-containing protein [Clavibacter michiganensis]
MNKIVSGAVAGAAGIVLLLGGAGSFALWNANATVAASSVSSGNLAISADTAGVWKDITNGGSKVIDPATYRIVPGNVLQYTSALTVTATGDSLAADLTYNPLSITGDPALKAAVTTKLDVTSTDASITASSTAANTFTVKPSTAASKVNVVLTVTFPSTATTGQNGTLSFDKLAFTLTQRAI